MFAFQKIVGVLDLPAESEGEQPLWDEKHIALPAMFPKKSPIPSPIFVKTPRLFDVRNVSLAWTLWQRRWSWRVRLRTATDKKTLRNCQRNLWLFQILRMTWKTKRDYFFRCGSTQESRQGSSEKWGPPKRKFRVSHAHFYPVPLNKYTLMNVQLLLK